MAKENAADEKPPFPWELGVFDAHCHPTDTMTSIASIPHMKATTLTVMATRGEDQELVEQVASELGYKGEKQKEKQKRTIHDNGNVIDRVIPCFGWHPWFAHQIQDDLSPSASALASASASASSSSAAGKIEHYRKVLTGSSGEEESFFRSLPDPKLLSTLLSETRNRLIAHPAALVGEIGLDKAFRLPHPWRKQEMEARDIFLTPSSREGRKLSPYRVAMSHQKALLKAQLQLAGELRRAVSIHSVQGHGAVFDLLQELWRGHERKVPSRRDRRRRHSTEGAHENSDVDEENNRNRKEKPQKPEEDDGSPLPFPPRLCMHSYSGPAEPLKQFLRPTVPSDIYFSFSAVINFTNPSADKVVGVIKSLPDDRLLVETDLHCAGQQMDDLLEEVVRTVCRLRGWTLENGVRQLADNWKRFIFG